jgi:two-component system, OmpR family, response regulator
VRERRLTRILLVDDDPDLLEVAALALGAAGGYTVEPCGSAREAVERSPSFRPDLILLDVQMPGTDGLAALRALREIETTAETPVVFMTGGGIDEIARYQELGCLGVIIKPFDPAIVPARLEALWGRRRPGPADVSVEDFETLRQIYLDKLPETIAAMRAAAAVLAEEGWDRSALDSLRHLAHRLAGTSGLYRAFALGRSAAALEDIVKRLLAEPAWPPASSPAQLKTLVKAVERAARSAMREPRPAGPAPRS